MDLEEKLTTPRYPIRGVEIKHFHDITEVRADFSDTEAPWIFLTGENGAGKTSVLQAMAMALGNVYEDNRFLLSLPLKENFRTILKAHFPLNEPKQVYWDQKYRLDQKADIEKVGSANFVGSENDFKPEQARNTLGYGASRLKVDDNRQTNKAASLAPLFEGQLGKQIEINTDLLNIEVELKEWYYNSELAKARQGKPQGTASDDAIAWYTAVKELLINILPGIVAIEERKHDGKAVFYYRNESGTSHTREQLAAGAKSLLALAGDILVRLHALQASAIKTPAELTGVVFIDELEVHLHANWQRKLPKLLHQAFPGVQFVASTHSPIPLLGAPKPAIFLHVGHNSKGQVTLTRLKDLEQERTHLLPNALLTSPLFKMENIFPEGHNPQGHCVLNSQQAFPESSTHKGIKPFDVFRFFQGVVFQ